MDISDGLLNDLSKICAASNVSATVSVNDLPIHENLQSCFPNIWDQLAVGGGEDYELLFTIPGDLKDKISQKSDVGFSVTVAPAPLTIADEPASWPRCIECTTKFCSVAVAGLIF